MREILPGVHHWEAPHPNIHKPVSGYWLAGEGVAIDPLLGGGASIEWFASQPRRPRAVLLSNRHHYRDSGRLQEDFGCRVLCNHAGLHEFTHGQRVEGFEPGEELPGGVRAQRVEGICPDETALHIPAARALVMGDGVVRERGEIGFVPDALMDDPPATKRALLQAIARLLQELDFEHLLLAHGGPVLGEGREQLRELVRTGGRTVFEL